MTTTTTDRRPLPVIGCDEGARWTGLCLRHGDDALNGTTLGPINGDGRPDLEALDSDDVAGLRARTRYVRNVVATIHQLIEVSQRQGLGVPGIVCEVILPPRPKAPHARKSWLVPTAVMYGVLAAFPEARLVSAQPARASKHYPSELVGRQPEHWISAPGLPVSKGRRDHERAAYDIAKVLAWTEDPR